MNLKPYLEYKDSGVAWLGKVPKHWEVHPLKRYAKNIINNVLSKNSDELYIALEHIEGWTGRFKKNRYAKFTGQVKKFSETDVLFGKLRPYLAKVAFPKEQGVCVGEILSIRPNGKYLLGSFIEKSFLSFHFIGIVNGATYGSKMPRAEWDFIGNLGFPILPIPEQTQIARFLDYKTAQIARFIKAKKRMIELLKEQKQVIINDAVTGKIDVATGKPYPKYKDSGVEWLGQVPTGWEVRRLKYVVKTNQEALSEKTSPSYEFNYLDISSVKTGYLISKPQKLLFENAPSRARRIVRKGDTIVSTVRTYLRSVLHIENECDDLIVSTGFAVLTPNEIIDQRYIGYMLRNDNFIDSVIRNSIGVSYPAISETKLGTLKILLPPSFIEQHQIVTYIETKTAALDQAISRTEREIGLMQEYRTRLVSDVVTGKIDVRDIEIPDIADIDDTIDESIEEPEGEEELETAEAEE